MSPKTAKNSTAPAVAPQARIAPRQTPQVSRLNTRELQQKIAERAFLLFEKRGRVDGYHQQDWVEAEVQIKRELKIS